MALENIHYARDGVPGLSLAAQEAALVMAGARSKSIVRDRLSSDKMDARQRDRLEQRRKILLIGGCAGNSTLVVASLRVLGWTLHDVCLTLHKAGQAGLAVRILDLGVRLSVDELASPLLRALVESETHRRRSQTAKARLCATGSARGRPPKMTPDKLTEARRLWVTELGLSCGDIAAKLSVSRRTLYTYFGRRPAPAPGSVPLVQGIPSHAE